MVTISNLRKALSAPTSSFTTLKGLVWDNSPIIRSTYFAETRIEFSGRAYLLSMPLANVAMHRVERFCVLKRHLKSKLVPALKILRNEMLYTDTLGNEQSCDILLEPLPNALPYTDALANAAFDKAEAESLLAAIDTLEKELSAVDVSLNNLRKENIYIDSEGLLRPIRWYHATNQAGGDKDNLALLRQEIICHQEDMELHDTRINYSTATSLSGHLSVHSIFEGLIAVEDESGWGFVDSDNHSIIESKFGWVSDFREGRAEVEYAQAMGLIDKCGNFIIDPLYDILDYDHISGQSRALKDGVWHIFDYSGNEVRQEQ